MRSFVVVCVFLLIVGCGGGGSSLPEDRPFGTVSGVVVDGPIVGTNVKAYSFSGGQKGELLASTVSDGESHFKLFVKAPDQPVLLEIDSGIYVEEASGSSVSLREGDTLKALFFYKSSESHRVNVTPYTFLATGLAEFYLTDGFSVEQAMTQAATEVSSIFGLDVHATTPLAINRAYDPPPILDDSSLYGFLLAGLSGFTQMVALQNEGAVHGDYPTIELVRLMYEDIRSDGVLDGVSVVEAESVQLSIGGVPLNEKAYRNTMPQQVLTMANSSANQTGITPDDLLNAVTAVSTSSSGLIPGSQSVPSLDITGPIITAVESSEPQSQLINFSVTLEDESEIAEVRFDLNGVDLGAPADLAAPEIVFDSRTVSDGVHRIGVKAEDSVGNFSYKSFSIVIDNSPPLVNLTSPVLVNDTAYTLRGQVSFEGAAVDSLDVVFASEMYPVPLAEDGTWQLSLSLEAGRNEVTFIVSDIAGNTAENKVMISVDRGLPSVIDRYSEARLSLESGESWYPGGLEEVEIEDNNQGSTPPPVFIYASDLSLGQSDFTETLLFEKNIPYITLHISDKAVLGVGTPKEQVKVSMRYLLGDASDVDWLPLSNNGSSENFMKYLIPLITETLGEGFAGVGIDDINVIEVKAEDNAGNIKSYTFKFRAHIYDDVSESSD